MEAEPFPPRNFLQALPKRRRYAFEFRHESWNAEPVYDLLARFNAAHCIYHLAGFQSPLRITADFTCVRLHGPDGKYQGAYDESALRAWADRISEWQSLTAVYVYFDNDQSGYAPHDALRLKERVG